MAIRVGRPRVIETNEELTNRIQNYFDSITIDVPRSVMKKVDTEDGEDYVEEPLINNAGEQVVETEFIKNPSVTALCLHIGIHRDTLHEYEKKDEFSDTIRIAKQIILSRKLELLTELKNPRGVMFDLSANYGIVEKKEIESTNTNVNVEVDSLEEAEEIIKAAGLDPDKL